MNPMTHADVLKALFLTGADLDLTDRHAAQYALGLGASIERAAQRLLDSMTDGNEALRAIADEPPFSDEPFADDIRATIAARRIPVATPEEDEALDRIEQAHPEPNFAPVDMVDLAARALGFQKGA